MKKDLEWAKKQMKEIIDGRMTENEMFDRGYQNGITNSLDILNQLDEPETLSLDWIDDNKKDSGVHSIGYYVPIGRLQNLLVPKQDERMQLETAYKDILERGEFWFDNKKYVVVEKRTVEEEWAMEWLDNNDFYDHRTAETVLADAVDKGELGYYGTKYSVVEKPVIPKFVADWIEKYIEYGYDLYPALKKMENNSRSWGKTYDWYRNNTLEFALAYLTKEYGIEEEQKEKQGIKTESVEEVVADFGRSLERLRELWRSMEVEELEK